MVVFLFFNTIPHNTLANEVSSYEHMMKNEKFVKAYYEHSVELSTYFAGKYTDNRDYVRSSIDEVISNAKQGWENFKQFEDDFHNLSFTEKYKELTSMLIGGFMTIPTSLDLKGLWKQIFNKNSKEEVNPEFYSYHSDAIYLHGIDLVANQYYWERTAKVFVRVQLKSSSERCPYLGYVYLEQNAGTNSDILFETTCMSNEQVQVLNTMNKNTLGFVFHLANFADPNSGLRLRAVADETTTPVNIYRNVAPPAITTINNYYNDPDISKKYLPDTYKPNFRTYLMCDGQQINLSIVGDKLVASGGVSYPIPVDDVINVKGVDCSLEFEKPKISYDDNGDVRIIDTFGIYNPENQLEIPIVCDLMPCGSTGGQVQPVDNTLLAYIRNSYDYATAAVSNGVQGLQKVASGFMGITGLVGSVFAFLPTEMTIFISGAFMLTVGLWVFKR